ncbi:MAG: hypothetical protein IPN17_02640 [Deltaproteobacteria bacterium]|nr:hypothetical protein [Deltaproteobacteria bacterium]MBK8691217.1 hypothetical protein [Deltaproteobacteria bacterium]MBP6829510.1 hypothetical protein [Deltaproteobacteria bacterium]
MRRTTARWSFALLAALSASCTSPLRGASEECLFNGDCREGLLCAGRRCRVVCRDGRDCAGATRCASAGDGRLACLPPDEPPYCRRASECAEAEVCLRGRCVAAESDASTDALATDATEAPADTPSLDAAEMPDVGMDAGPPDAPDAPDAVDATADLEDAPTDRVAADLAAPIDRADVSSDRADDVSADAADDASVLRGVVEICASADRTCARGSGGQVWCWGSNDMGGLARPPSVPSSTRPLAVEGAAGATLLACGGPGPTDHGTFAGHSCVRLADGRVACWGLNLQAQSGAINDTRVAAPAVRVLDGPVAALALGSQSTLAMTSSGALWGWGLDDAAVLLGANGLTSVQREPRRSVIREPVVMASIANHHACALGVTGVLYCAGDNSVGEVASFAIGDNIAVPLAIDEAAPFARDIVSIATGVGQRLTGGFTCVATRDGAVRCRGQLAFLPGGGATRFTEVAELRGARRLYTNAYRFRGRATYVCARRDDLTVRCLDAQRSAAPIDLPVDDAYDLALGYNHLCVLRSDGSVWCSGDNNLGQLGSGDTVGSAALRRVVF